MHHRKQHDRVQLDQEPMTVNTDRLFWAKRLFDITAGSLLLLALFPVMVVVAVMVRSDGGPAIYSHTRVGRNGQRFGCLKFRSMVVNSAEVLQHHLAGNADAMAEWMETRKLNNDPRITSIGRILRKTSLDELPQLVNVLRGEMSIVGPRPITEDEMLLYGDQLGLYLSVSPGMTGSWQVSGRSNTTYSRRVNLDAEYARNAGMHTDVAILTRTPLAVVKSKGAK